MATLYSAVQATPDASETVEGKLRIATNAEGLAGTDDTTAMTPLKTANAIAASASGVTGALVYRGSYDASTASPDLTTASKGDFYIVSVAGSLAAQALNIGDHIVFNQNAASPITSAMFDVIDNTDAIASVNGQTGVVTLTASDVGALATGDNVSSLTNDSGYITSNLSASITVDTNGAYDLGTESARFDKVFGDLDGAVCFKAKNASGAQITKGQPVYISGTSGDVPEVNLADADAAAMPSAGLAGETVNAGAEIRIITFGNLVDVDTSSYSLGDTLYIDTTAGALIATPPAGEAAKIQNIGKVIRAHATSGVIKVGGAGRSAATPNLDQNKIFLGDSNNRAVSTALSSVALSSFNNDLGLAAVATTGAYSDLSGTPTLATVATSGAYSDLSGTPTLATVATTGAYSDLSGTPTLGTAAALDVGTSASNVVQLDGSARLPAVDGSQLTNLPSGATQLNDLSDVTITGASTGEVLRYSGAAWVDATLAYSDLSGTPTLATVATSGAYSDLSGTPTLATVATSGAYSDLSGTPTLGTAAALDVGTSASNVVQLDGSARLPAVDGSQLTNLPSASAASETVAGVIEIATNAEAGAGTATDKALVPSNVSSLSIGSGQVSGLATVATTGAYSDLSGTPTLATVATSGAYSDLSGTPTLATVATTGAYSDLSGTPTLGTAAALDVGTSASNVVQLDGSARLPAVDGSQLTNLPSGATQLNDLSDVTITGASTGEVLRYSGAAWVDATLAYSDLSGTPTLATVATSGAYSDLSGTPSLGTAAAQDVGTSASNVVQLDGSARLPAVDGSQLTNLPSASAASETVAGIIEIATNAEAGAGTATDKALVPSNVSSLSIGSGQVSGLATVATSGAYSDLSGTPTLATVATSGAYSDLSGTPSLGTAAAQDVGTSASNVVQLDGSARLPAVDGSQLTNLPSGGGGTIPDVVIDGSSGDVTAVFATSGTNGDNERVYLINNSTSARTVTLPAVSGNSGKKFQIKVLGTGNVTVAVQSGENLETTTNGTYVISDQYSSVTLLCNASGTLDGWYII